MTSPDTPPSRRFRWVSALLASVLAAVFVDAAIYALVPPEYEAASLLRVFPPASGPFSPPSTGEDAREAHVRSLASAVATVSSDRVLDHALGEPSIKNATSLGGSASPREDLRAGLTVVNLPHTDFLRVSYVSHSPEEAAKIVNAVVASYLQATSEFEEGSEEMARKRMNDYFQHLSNEVGQADSGLSAKVAQMNQLGVVSPEDSSPTSFTSLTEDLRRTIAEQLVQADLELAREGDGPKAAELKRTQSALRALLALPGTGFDSARFEIERLRVEAAAGRLEEVRRKLDDEQFTNSRLRPGVVLSDLAAPPNIPSSDRRGPLMACATGLILLVGLAVALHRGEPLATGEPVADGV
ncbi:hypothetical protein [Planctomyces sp. SH-PL62]|uniref:hypothetical protein n=1 Tax=Planctomyces sp. SH-PL62 TaxID=1636152 RepID=UPI00078C407A|nr:hypothetical protein [Planctomyces sp. SH-PL62]AMV37968.1 hypothetical protein VT85_11065 [Planctomyces sp. SH-PL62]